MIITVSGTLEYFEKKKEEEEEGIANKTMRNLFKLHYGFKESEGLNITQKQS